MGPNSEDQSDTPVQLKHQTRQLAQQAQEAAGQVVDQVQQQTTSLIAMQKDRATQGMTSLVQALRQTGQQLTTQDQETASRALDTAAAQLERLAGYLERRDVSQLIGDAEDVVRRQPALLLGSAFALGVLASRFLKSSAPDRSLPPAYNAIAPAVDVGQPVEEEHGAPVEEVPRESAEDVQASADEAAEETPEEDVQDTVEIIFEPSRKLEEKIDGTSD
jgi:hypothetical protein